MTLEKKREELLQYCNSTDCGKSCKLKVAGWCEKHMIKRCNEEALDEGLKIIGFNEKVDHPSHYQGKNECIDVMLAMFGVEAVKGFCKCNAYKCRFRAGQKEGNSAEQDIEKAEWYETYLMELERKVSEDGKNSV